MNWFWLIVGLLVGWLVEWVIDWIYWRRGSSDNAAELENLRAQNRRLRADLDSATGSVNKIKAEAADANGKLSTALSDGNTLRADNARLQAELQALRDSAASQADASAELARLRARMNVVKGAAASFDDQVNALVSERDALKGENERLNAQFSASAAAASSSQFATQQLSGAEVQSALELEQLRTDNARLQAELQALRDSATSQAEASAELNRVRARMNVANGAAAYLDDQMSALRGERDALKSENERLQAQFSASASAAAASSNQFATQQLSSAEVQSALDLERLRAENERLHAELDALRSRPRRDPLIDINGIGPVIEKRLFEAGIFTFEQLAEQSPDYLRQIARLQSWQEADPAAWIVEARERAAQKSGS